jgi:hypothetical protein
MATLPDVVLLSGWEHFQGFLNGQPLIGGLLYTYAANTTTPKAAYHDPYFIVPHANPIVLDEQGAADVWLDGLYHLRLTDKDGVQLWTIPSFQFASGAEPQTGGVQSGMNEATVVPNPGTGVISVPGLVPLGYRCLGVIARINVEFGASQGLTQLALGDTTLLDGWGVIGRTAGLTTTQRDFRRGDEPIAQIPYTILVSALDGSFDGAGSLTLRATWQAINGWTTV